MTKHALATAWLVHCAALLLFALGTCQATVFAESPGPQPLPWEQVKSQGYEFVHPGIAHSQENLGLVKQKIKAGEQPWTDAFRRLQQSRFADLSWRADPQEHVERGARNDPDIGSTEFVVDGNACYTLALCWALTGEEAYARKAAEIIDAWSGTLLSIGNHDAKLLIGMLGHQYCNAAELLRHTWNGWPESRQARFEAMIKRVWLPIIEDFYPTANGNWDASMIQTMLAMGVFTEDRQVFNRAIEYYLHGEGNGAVRNYFNEFGECQESGRDQSHTQMGLEFLLNACETAWIQGIDLYSAYDDRLLKGFEYTAKYNLGFEVPYEPYTSFEKRYYYPKISNEARGRLRPMYHKALNHYGARGGKNAEYTSMAAVLTASGSAQTHKNSRRRLRGASMLLWDELMYAQPLVSKDDSASDDDAD